MNKQYVVTAVGREADESVAEYPSLRAEAGESFAGGMAAKMTGLPKFHFDLGDELTWNSELKAD